MLGLEMHTGFHKRTFVTTRNTAPLIIDTLVRDHSASSLILWFETIDNMFQGAQTFMSPRWTAVTSFSSRSSPVGTMDSRRSHHDFCPIRPFSEFLGARPLLEKEFPYGTPPLR